MKKVLSFLFIFALSILTHNNLISQSENHEGHSHKIDFDEKKALNTFGIDKFINEINLSFKSQGFDFKKDKCLKNFFGVPQSRLFHDIFEAYGSHATSSAYSTIYTKYITEFNNHLTIFSSRENEFRAEYQKRKNSSIGSVLKGTNPTPQAACTNQDFEMNNFTAWNVSSGAGGSYVTTAGFDAAVPSIPTVYNGLHSACLNALTGSSGIRDGESINQTFLVTSANSNYVFYVAVITDAGAHACGSNPYFTVNVKNTSGAIVPCSNITLEGSATGGVACSAFTGWATSGAYDFLNWTPVVVPLGSYIGQNVTISFATYRCDAGGHGCRAYVEASCDPFNLTVTGNGICPGVPTSLLAPIAPGYVYNWSGPSGFSASTSSISTSLAGAYTVTMSLSSNSACKMTLDTTLIAVANPTANFNYTVTPCATTNSVPVVSTSTAAPGDPLSSYTWVWGDATTNGTVTPTNHVYATTGVKTVELIVQSVAGCRDSIQKTFTFAPGPTASFTSTNVCLNTPNSFSSTSTPTAGIASQVWTWGDGTPNGSGTSPSHTYSSAGTYSVKLVVTAAAGSCTASVTQTVVVYPKPTVTFTANPMCLNSTTSFTNSTTITAPGTINAWAWDFDNNGTTDNTTQSPSNTYTPSGTYNVELKATSLDGCSDSLVVPIVVNANPTATFTPITACVNANVLLNNTSTIPLPNTISLYNWAFGAGSTPVTSSNQNPPSLTYNASGVKTITLTITANNSCTATITNTVTINPSPVANFSTTSVCQSTATVFADMSTTTTGTINTWAWDFTNDGASDNATQNPTFTYPLSGTYTAALTVSTTAGCANTYTAPVNVWGHTIPDFSPNNVCFGTSTTFNNNTNITTNANVGTIPTYSWDFADGSGVQVLAGSPAHTYTLGGNVNATYNVTLTATSSHTCIDNVVKTVNVYAIPTASFTSDSVCLGSPSHMVDASNGNGNAINNYIWDFLSNGTIDATGVSNPNFTFPAYGNNAVTYTASTTPVAGLTCQNITSTITVWVNPIPVPSFTFVNKCINAQPNTFDASSSTIAVGTNTAYTWAFGDGATSPSNITPTHTFVTAGLYNTTLTVTSNKGCQISITKQVEVYQKPLMSITASSACFKSAMTFTAVSIAGSGTVNSWNWDFNNTIASFEGYGEFPNYNFPAAGSQTVHLVASTTHGCIDTFITQVYVDYLPTPAFTVDKPSGCPLHCVTFTDNTPALTAPGINNSWQWVFGDGATITATNSANQNHCYDNTSNSQSAFFDVKLIVTSDKGCKDSLNKPAFITVYPTPIAQYTVDPNPGSIVSPTEHFINQSIDYTKWWWCFGDGPISDSTNLNPFHTYLSPDASDYYSYLIVANQYGCKDTAKVKVEIGPEFIFYIPNAFTPDNGDGINDFFTGMGVGIDTYEMWIFDRWGVNIYYSDDIHKGWNGKVQGKDALVQQDVYIWKVKIKDVLGKKHDYVGHVTVLR
jgi:gliding motility-associated-like protein